jgi:Heterokaryon incompatibility protein (HET)
MTARFKYEPLQAPKNQIRLLKLHRAVQLGSELIRCSIETFEHEQCPPYIAVSYHCGDANYKKHILLNGYTFEVPESIWQFLLILQHTESGSMSWLWVDSICINQKTTLEKSLQVAKMGEIYSRAKIVWIWLGQFLNKTESAINFIMNNEVREPTVEESEGLEELFNRSFWKRIWIVQEIMLATELKVFCGDISFPWHMFTSTTYRLLMEADKNKYAASLMRTNAIRIIQAKVHWSNQKLQGLVGLPLLRLLQIYSKFEVSDWRDKIYGLLALSSSHCTYPNYGLDESEASQRRRMWEEQIKFRISYRTQPEDLFASAITSIIHYSIQYEHQRWTNKWGRWLVKFLFDLLGLPERDDIDQLSFPSADMFLSAVL